MIETVETYDGSVAARKNCRFIKNEFYIKNKQCFNINGTWYRINCGLIAFDNEKQDWVLIKDNPTLVKGIIGYSADKEDIILGYYTSNLYKNTTVLLPNGSSYNCIDYKILPSSVFVEDTKGMYFVHHSMKKSSGIPQNVFANNGYPCPPPYCCKHYAPEISKLFKEGAKRIGKRLTKISSYISNIGNYTFGFEFETNKGKIPNYKILESGLMPLRDGSINGIEFATIALSGEEGIGILENACSLLERYTVFTEQESLHLHIGNTSSNKKFVGYLYTVLCILEKEIFSMFPKYYAQTSKFKAKGKDYNIPLKKELVAMTPEETFDNIAFYLSSGKKYQGFGAEHPSDPEGHAKWSIAERYHWVNLIPLLFGSNKTIEFRVHIPTRDPIKVINWLYICSAIIKYSDSISKKNIDLSTLKSSLSLKQIINEAYGYKLASYLNEYIDERKKNRRLDDASGDYIGANEIYAELHNNVLYKDIN